MRYTEKELKQKYAGDWNDKKGNIVDIMYGDVPHTKWTKEIYEKYKDYDIAIVERYIFSQMGDFNEYRTLIGGSYIKSNGTVLGCDININYRGMLWHVTLNECYGFHKLQVLYLPYGEGIIQGWCTMGNSIADMLSPTGRYKNTEHDILAILDDKRVSDYGYGIKQALKRCRELYLEDTRNYFDTRG